MYRLPCTVMYIRDRLSSAYTLTLSRADLPPFISFVEKIKEGSYKGVELVGKDGKICRIGREGGLLVFVIGDLTLRLDEDQDGCFVSFLADMTADAPRYDHIDLEFRDARVDLTVRVER